MATLSEIEAQVAEYCATRPEIVACYLFGSHATGRARPGSDVDLAFLLASDVPKDRYGSLQLEYFSALSDRLHRDIHPLIMNNAGEVVLEQVFRKGVVLYGGDAMECARFRMTQTVLIAEFAPVRKRMEENLFRRYKDAPHG
jgi:predicted nucleotidyltransferase